jgi:ABC-type transport system involved in cytochrome bd biosynthesis fused ATPase/permease subunit
MFKITLMYATFLALHFLSFIHPTIAITFFVLLLFLEFIADYFDKKKAEELRKIDDLTKRMEILAQIINVDELEDKNDN